jgi:prepilin peptidase CpaA
VSWLTVLLWIAALTILATIAVVDLKRRIIPNELVLATVAVGIGLRLVSASGMLWQSALAMAGTFLILGAIGRLGVIGGGDVKLIPAVSLLAPADHVLALLLDIAIAGGVLSIAYLVARPGRRAAALLPGSNYARTMTKAAFDDGVPYGLAVCIGAAFYVAHEALRCFYAISCSL